MRSQSKNQCANNGCLLKHNNKIYTSQLKNNTISRLYSSHHAFLPNPLFAPLSHNPLPINHITLYPLHFFAIDLILISFPLSKLNLLKNCLTFKSKYTFPILFHSFLFILTSTLLALFSTYTYIGL